ncbi:MAG: HEAT repeat domain-containing protein [Myxococcales bacterium]|nr:HEAT repeat domain-containing protein [Myxococcales bacterium]
MGALRALLAVALLVLPGPVARADAGPGWVGPLVGLEASPAELFAARVPLASRIALARRLGRYGPAEGAVEALLGGREAKPPPALRDAILLSLARRASPAAVEPVAKRLEASGTAPIHAFTVLSAVGDREALSALADALDRPEQRAAAARALRLSGPAAGPVLAAALTGPAAPLAVRSLEKMGAAAAAAVPALVSALAIDDLRQRAAVVRALGAIGEAAAAAPLLAHVDDPEPVGAAVAVALGQVATPRQAATLRRLYERAGAKRAAQWIPALVRADPAGAAPVLERALAKGDARTGAALEALMAAERPHRTWLRLLAAQLRGPRGDGAASALARAGAFGVEQLLDARGVPAMRVARPLAIALRGEPVELEGLRERGLSWLRGLPASPARRARRALAQEPQVGPRVAAALRGQDVGARAAAGWAALWLADPELSAPVAAALARERDPEVFRRLAAAAGVLRAPVAPGVLEAHFERPETGPEALLLAATLAMGEPPRALRLRLRRLLSSRSNPRVRVASARALAVLGDRSAVAPLLAALSDPAAELRMASARALSVLAPERARRELRAHGRIEVDGRVRGAVRRLSRAQETVVLAPAGGRVLQARLRGPAVPRGLGPEVDVLLQDGRWLRMRPLFEGHILLADLPGGRAQLRVLP